MSQLTLYSQNEEMPNGDKVYCYYDEHHNKHTVVVTSMENATIDSDLQESINELRMEAIKHVDIVIAQGRMTAELETHNAMMRDRIALLEDEGQQLVARVTNLKLTFPGFSTMFDAGTASMRAALEAVEDDSRPLWHDTENGAWREIDPERGRMPTTRRKK